MSVTTGGAGSGSQQISTLGTITTGTWGATNISLAKGGTNASLTPSNGGIFYSTTVAGAILAGTATANQVLLSGSSTTPAWSTATYPATTTINQLLYSSSANTISGLSTLDNGILVTGTTGIPALLANGTAGYVLTANTGAPPSWQALPSSAVTFTGDSGTPFSTSSVTITGASTGLTFAASTPDLTLGGTLALANGGTNANLTASNGGIFYSTASAGAILAGTATAKQMLQSGSSTTPAWSTSTWPATTTANQILYSSSNSVVAEITAAANGVLITSNSNVPSLLANGTAGYVLTANTSAPPSWQAAPTFSNTGVLTAFTTYTSGSPSVSGAVGNGYYGNGCSLLTVTIPATSAIGDIIEIGTSGASGGTWRINQGNNQQIFVASNSTTQGSSGYIVSNDVSASITLRCMTANLYWLAIYGYGEITTH